MLPALGCGLFVASDGGWRPSATKCYQVRPCTWHDSALGAESCQVHGTSAEWCQVHGTSAES